MFSLIHYPEISVNLELKIVKAKQWILWNVGAHKTSKQNWWEKKRPLFKKAKAFQ